MRFLDSLHAKYSELQLEKPHWLEEYTATPAVTPVQAVQNVVSTVGNNAASGVVSALMKAMDVLQDDPDVQKIKTDVTQKVADAKKQISAAGTKTIENITKAVAELSKKVDTSKSATLPVNQPVSTIKTI